MAGAYRVDVKESVFENTGLDRDEFENTTLSFESEASAREWVDEQNELFPVGNLVLHTAHPNDASGVDAYLISKQGRVWVYDE